jgi:hypothetical protein
VRRVLALAGAALALAGAAALLFLARDIRAWDEQIARDDVTFVRAPGHPGLWKTRELLPGGAARRLLGLDDDLRFRDAVRTFRLGRPRQVAYLQTELLAVRGQAQVELWELSRTDPDPGRRSQAANLVGVLSLGVEGRESPQARARFLGSGISSFQTAVQLDDRNERAKYNLELTLRVRDTDTASLDAAGSVVPRDNPSGAGLRGRGSGY